jgi:hypothetical protein
VARSGLGYRTREAGRGALALESAALGESWLGH